MTGKHSDRLDDQSGEHQEKVTGAAHTRADETEAADESSAAATPADSERNPPRTTTGGWFTAPKFGSAGSGGAELEPGPERD